MDGYFSLPPGVFQAATEILFQSDFESSREAKRELQEWFESSDIF